jgi:predicted nucleic acid-binding protein
VTFVDTSALLAFLDRDAARHAEVVAEMTPLLAERSGVTHNYALVETEALVHRRHGGRAARRLLQDVVPLLDVAWVTRELHDAAVASHLDDLRRRTSLVDHVSFQLMRGRGLRRALTLDRHFREAGFTIAP